MQDHLIGASKLRYMGRFRSTAYPDQGMYDEPRSWLVSADSRDLGQDDGGREIGTGLHCGIGIGILEWRPGGTEAPLPVANPGKRINHYGEKTAKALGG